MKKSVAKKIKHFGYVCLSVLLSANWAAATTLSVQTANTTSASSSFSGLANGDSAPGNISTVPLRNMLPSTWKGKVLAHWMPWWGCTDGTSFAAGDCNGFHTTDVNGAQVLVHYSTEDPSQIDKILADMIARGYDGVMVAQSNTSGLDQNSTVAMAGEMSKFPKFSFSVGENGLGNLNELESDMEFANSHYFNLSNYLRDASGRPVVYVFDNGSVDWTTAAASCAGNPRFVISGPSNATSSVGAFFWFASLAKSADTTGAAMLSVLDAFYSGDVKSNPNNIYSGDFFKGFNDTYAPWGTNSIVDQDCGLTYVNSLSAMSSVLGSSATASNVEWIQDATWDDYEEGTELETGISNCGSVTASVSGTVITPKPSFTGVGSEKTVDHYEVFLSTDGTDLTDAGSASTAGGSLDVSKLGLAGGTYDVYVKMVGVSNMLNHMSPVASVKITSSTPVSGIAVSSPASGASVSSPVSFAATVTESYVPARIQIWDSVSGDKITDITPTATKTSVSESYSSSVLTPGSHTLTINVLQTASGSPTDSATVTFTVTAAAPVDGITVTSPTAGSSVNPPVTLTGTVKESYVPARIQIWDSLSGDKITDMTPTAETTSLSESYSSSVLAAGSHTLTINVLETASGSPTDSKTVTFTVK